MKLKEALGQAFMKARKSAGHSQEDFGVISSRTYVSHIERGLSSITLDKLNDLTSLIGIHPAAIIIKAYLIYDDKTLALNLISRILDDLKKLD